MNKRTFGAAGIAGTIAATVLLLPGAVTSNGAQTASEDAARSTTAVAAAPANSTSTAATSSVNDEPPAGYSSEFAKVNGFQMHYMRGGKGSPVVLLHGFPQTWAEWRPQMDALAKEHTVIAVDLRGTGDSGVPKEGYDAVQLAKDVHVLLKQLGLHDGVQVVAHDIGLWVAYPYAAMWPSEVKGMAVMEGPIPDERIYSFPALAPKGGLAVWHLGFFNEKLADKLIPGHERDLVETFITQYLTVKKAFTPAEFEFLADYLREPGRLNAWMQMYRELHTDVAQNKRFKSQGPLNMPILAIGGEDALGASIGDQWKEYATDVDAKVLRGSGHWVTEERPRELTSMLLNFLK
ncbi:MULTISPECIES: alpha/beta hydrolase [Streptomyces]|jgi:pimeloyl-ACP methyl ester carboxylesterase|uniref:alpha/beta fold hydrolase n=1 Tax=Streptomyces TaxID=1883 RepID=UPI002F908620|nr:alpha/beta hydrolase [Streptomyces chartreusis]WTA33519.1 alpha/beta hydrolase [Streptomyces chartreusis]